MNLTPKDVYCKFESNLHVIKVKPSTAVSGFESSLAILRPVQAKLNQLYRLIVRRCYRDYIPQTQTIFEFLGDPLTEIDNNSSNFIKNVMEPQYSNKDLKSSNLEETIPRPE